MFQNDDRVDPAMLGEVSLFHGFEETQLVAVAELGRRRDVEAGVNVLHQGRYGLACHVVVTGTADVYIDGTHVASVSPGEVVGEMALIGLQPRNATVVAADDMVLVEFGVAEFREFLQAHPMVEAQIVGMLERRAEDNRNR
jgi:CRP-like cAMP-binding protein